MNTEPHGHLTWRMDLGRYVILKLACGGGIFSLLQLLAWMTADLLSPASGLQTGLPAELWAYGCGLPAVLAGDLLLCLLPRLEKHQQLSVRLLCGFGLYTILSMPGPHPWINGAAGLVVMLLYRTGHRLFVPDSLWQLVFAFPLPLLCLLLIR
ncbi:hypothetical protein Q5741_09800 [Paenibacillus sp. JX-17]|uniref:Uncharacterized protein n=1 Tax=Paenibacillus lacisoli TaxID=3064525 RepID=A0ABT9CCW0_9BACL|nr:hypothetical protein [Paenibacillus sp. JX-17]MDO7906715.1 hypothetical protein [Paenibacillus sp. JX-17]